MNYFYSFRRNFYSFRQKKSFFVLFAGIITAIFLFLSLYTIDEGQRGVVLTFGEISKSVDSGLHFRIPFIQTVKKYNVRVQKSVFGDTKKNVLSAYSYDQQIIESYRISLTYQYDPKKIEDIYRYFGTGDDDLFMTVVLPIVQQTTKSIFGRFTAQTIVQERIKLESVIDETLKNTLAKYPIIILGTQLEDVNFSRTYEAIIEQTALKKQEIAKAENELRRVEIEARQQVAQAEAKNQAVKLEADAKAYQIATQAKAEADAIKMKGEALKANPELVDLTAIEKWNGTVPQTLLETGGNGANLLPLLNIK